MSLKDYVKDNWDGWPLHTLIALLSMYQTKYPFLMVLANTAFWPTREAYQHEGFGNIWTVHRILEWGLPVVASALYYIIVI